MLALGVFDGHSGSEAAHFAKEKLLGHIKVSNYDYCGYIVMRIFCVRLVCPGKEGEEIVLGRDCTDRNPRGKGFVWNCFLPVRNSVSVTAALKQSVRCSIFFLFVIIQKP